MQFKHIKTISILLLLSLLLTSCSSYFSAGVSGTVKDSEDDSTISGVLVCAYTDSNARDAAFNGYTYSFENKFKGDSAIFRTTTANDGTFSIKSIKWNTTSPTYGKDGDNITVYPLFYHEDYGLIKGDAITITSSSINEGASQKLTKIREEKTITIVVQHPTKPGTTYTNEYSFKLADAGTYTNNPDIKIYEDSTNTFRVNYTKDADTPKLNIVKFKNIVAEENQTSRQCKNDTTLTFFTGAEINNITENLNYDKDKSTYVVYAKPIRFSYPTITGRLTSGDEVANRIYGKEEDNHQAVHITKSTATDTQLGATVYTTSSRSGDTNITTTNGQFSINLGSYTYTDTNYTGEYPTSFNIYLHYPNSTGADTTKEIAIDGKSNTVSVGAITR